MNDLQSLSLKINKGLLHILDQTLLPHQEEWICIGHPSDLIQCIQRLAVRGAPLIGISASLSWALFCQSERNPQEIKKWWELLKQSRPTAVNLMNNLDRMFIAYESKKDLLQEAQSIFFEDIEICQKLAERGAQYIQDGDQIITHCNTGGLATAGRGTALGVIRKAHEQGKKIHVYVDETRPLLQGARLTTWELAHYQIPFTLICDNMAAALMKEKAINNVFVGADRIAVNGDFANKIGTYSLAIAAKHHQVPFYVVAPRTTFDPQCISGSQIPIEQRSAKEVIGSAAPETSPAWNPSFDVTPHSLVTKIIFNDGELTPTSVL